jgi:hypothetical protein
MLPDRDEQPANLRVPPSLAATGSQEISPVLRALYPSGGDALTDIKRADTANEKPVFHASISTNGVSYIAHRWLQHFSRQAKCSGKISAILRSII